MRGWCGCPVTGHGRRCRDLGGDCWMILQVEWIFSGASIFWMLVSVAAMLGGLVVAVWIAAASRGRHPAARSGSRHA